MSNAREPTKNSLVSRTRTVAEMQRTSDNNMEALTRARQGA